MIDIRLRVWTQVMSEACRASCRFLLLVSAARADDCPPVTSSVTSSSSSSSPQGGATVAACARDCETDADCDVTAHRCCADGCNRHCRPAVRRFHDGKTPSLEVAPAGLSAHNSFRFTSAFGHGRIVAPRNAQPQPKKGTFSSRHLEL